MNLEERAAAHAALGDPKRLLIAERLTAGDLTVAELADLVGLKGNLLAHHLEVLERAGLVRRRVSEGDRRHRYVSLQWAQLPLNLRQSALPPGTVAFVCTHNSARSQFAAALWEQTTGIEAISAGSHPAATVHPKAVKVAAELGVDISSAQPGGYDRIASPPDLVISVCDRARETGVPEAGNTAHWSVPDPVLTGTLSSFRSAFNEIAERVDHLADGL